MTKKDIAEQVSKTVGVDKSLAYDIVGEITRIVSNSLIKGFPVYLRGFGTFLPKKRKAKPAHNFETGETIRVEAKTVPYFKASKMLKKKVDLHSKK